MKHPLLVVVPCLLFWSGCANYGYGSKGITIPNLIDGNKNPEKIPTHVAAYLWFNSAARYMNDGEYPDRFVAALHDTGLDEVDQGALKGIISSYYETCAKLSATYDAKVSLGELTPNDMHALHKEMYLLALDALEQTKKQLSPDGAHIFADYIEASKRHISIHSSIGSELN
ncbi:MAG: hypothetical protein WAK48_23240 [Candidatus Acidiferrum sp.]|jgi:hypothetical protein